jgi:hypothetical protein
MRRNPPDAVSLDDIARDLASGTSRRQVLRVLGAGVAAGLVSLRGPAAALADRRCRRVGERCKQSLDCCVGTCCAGVCCADGQICQKGRCVDPPPPPPGGGPNREICICADGTVINQCAALDCASSAQQDAICGPLCAAHGGESATGCVPDDPACAA